MPIIHICCYWGRGNLWEWWANTFSSEGHIFISAIIIFIYWRPSSPLHHRLSDLTEVIIILVVISITIHIILIIVIPSVCWTKVMFLLLLIFRFNWEISQLGKWSSWIDSPLKIQFCSICWRRWNSFHLESSTKYQKHTFFTLNFF